MTDKQKLSTEDVAEQLKVSIETVKGWRARKQGPDYVKLGGRIYYTQDDIDSYVAGCKVSHQ